MNINVGGINIALLLQNQPKFATRKRPDIIIEKGHLSSPDVDLRGSSLILDQRYWSLYHKNGHKLFVFKPSMYIPGGTAIFNHSMNRGKICLADTASDGKILYCAMIIIRNILSLKERFVFHGCGIIDKSKGYLFLGESGAGKTTISRLWHKKGGIVVHDDLVVVYKRNSKFFMTGMGIFKNMKFKNSHPAKTVVLNSIFFLKHDQENTLVRKNQFDAFRAIIKNQPIFACDKRMLQNTLCFFSELVKTIPVSNLGFVPDFRCIDFIRNN